MEKRHDIVPAHLAVKAMRDNGYKNAAYAIAELVDNAIQAGATKVQVLLGEKTSYVASRKSVHIEEICIHDNGSGMSAEVLQGALQFGNGTHLNEESQSGIGKFGMGLPSSSISQCRRVDVYTWREGSESSISTNLDLDEIISGSQNSVPSPSKTAIPTYLPQVKGVSFAKKGTLVRWRNLDRLMWKTAAAVINNSEFLIGRMYRHFLNDGDVEIEFIVYDIDDPSQQVGKIRKAQANDPLYLMKNTQFGDVFKPNGKTDPQRIFRIRHGGKIHEVKVRLSVLKGENRKDQLGRTPLGRHADKNVGVSIVRARRELELEQSWVNRYDTRSRWWGAEIQFEPGLDEVFGVSNNKQHAAFLTHTSFSDTDSRLKSASSVSVKLDMAEDADPAVIHHEISKYISGVVASMMDSIKQKGSGGRSGGGPKRYADSDEQRGTAVIRERQAEGKKGTSDKGEKLPSDQRKKLLQDLLEKEAGYSPSDANKFSAELVDDGIKVLIEKKEFGSGIFFDIQKTVGELIIWLNTKHPAFPMLIEALETDSESPTEDVTQLMERLNTARSGLRLLLMAWARYEDELSESEQMQAEDTRVDWGRMARAFMRDV